MPNPNRRPSILGRRRKLQGGKDLEVEENWPRWKKGEGKQLLCPKMVGQAFTANFVFSSSKGERMKRMELKEGKIILVATEFWIMVSPFPILRICQIVRIPVGIGSAWVILLAISQQGSNQFEKAKCQ
jgi:hypothetical protein